MVVLSAKITLYAPSCHSLKDKRMILQSIIVRVRNKFNVSIAEVEAHDFQQTIVIGIASVSNNNSHCQNELDEVIRFIENGYDAEIIKVELD